MIKHFSSLCILTVLVVVPPGEAGLQVGADPKAVAKALEQYAASACAFGFSGTALVGKGQEVILHRGYGWSDRAQQIPNDTRTMFYIASLSKQFTAAAVLWLEAHGKLSVTDRISLYFGNVPDDKASITIHQLLTHTSGLARFGWDDTANDWRVMTRDEAVNGISP